MGVPTWLLASLIPALLQAQQPSFVLKEAKPGLKARATLPADSAVGIALGRVPGGKILEAEVEEEHAHLVYSFDIQETGKPGIREIQVDARTGKVVSDERESETDEQAEQKRDLKPRP
jgi:uncharacterized membrane protein YkoI